MTLCKKITGSSFDAIILGGGINGASIAKALSENGKKVLLIEKNTLGCGTSSKSSRLIHGGLRYLETFSWSLVYESLKARTELCKTYPQLVKMTPFYFPIFADSPRPAWQIRIGLWLYDLLSSFKYPSQRVPLTEFAALYPMLRMEGIKAVFRYYDGKTNDLRLTRQLAQEAIGNGTCLMENSTIESIVIEASSDILVSVNQQTYHTKTLINATGPWIDEVNKQFNLPASHHIEKDSGIHISINRSLPFPLFLQAKYPRIFFMIPQGETTLIGTTERAESGLMQDLQVNQEDIDYLITEANRYLKLPISRSDIIDSFIGVRILAVPKKGDLSRASREAKLEITNLGRGNKVIQVFGGKLTSAIILGRKVACYVN